MSIFGRARQAFTRGIQLSMDLPQDFAWEDQVIPLKLHLTNAPGQPDTTVRLSFYLYDEDKGTRSNSGTEKGVNHRWTMDEPIALASGASLDVPVQMPLPFDADAIAAATAAVEQGESFAEKLAGRLTLGAVLPPTHLPWFRLRASAKVDGALLGARASGKIRCRNAGSQFSVGPFRN